MQHIDTQIMTDINWRFNNTVSIMNGALFCFFQQEWQQILIHTTSFL